MKRPLLLAIANYRPRNSLAVAIVIGRGGDAGGGETWGRRGGDKGYSRSVEVIAMSLQLR